MCDDISVKCEHCNGSGEIAVSTRYPMAYQGPGPVDEEAKLVTPAECPRCEGTGEIEEEPS